MRWQRAFGVIGLAAVLASQTQAQTLRHFQRMPQIAPPTVTLQVPTPGLNLTAPRLPPLTPQARTAFVQQLTGSPNATANGQSLRYSGSEVPEGGKVTVRRALLNVVGAGMQLDSEGLISIAPAGISGLALFACDVINAGPQGLNWQGISLATGQSVGSTAPYLSNQNRVFVTVDISALKDGEVNFSSTSNAWYFFYCEVTPISL